MVASGVADIASDCCTPVGGASLSEPQATDLAALFKALADPVRVRLLSIIASAPAGEACACDLTAPSARSQATVSHHLTVLTTAGLIVRQQRGRWAWFRMAPGREAFVRFVLDEALPSTEPALP